MTYAELDAAVVTECCDKADDIIRAMVQPMAQRGDPDLLLMMVNHVTRSVVETQMLAQCMDASPVEWLDAFTSVIGTALVQFNYEALGDKGKKAVLEGVSESLAHLADYVLRSSSDMVCNAPISDEEPTKN